MEKELKELETELYSEDEVETLQKTINELTNQNTELRRKRLPSNVDQYAMDFIGTMDEHDLNYLSTQETFEKYLDYRRKYTTNGEDFLSMRMLNAVIKNYFPNAAIKHSNRHKKNVYFWVFEENK